MKKYDLIEFLSRKETLNFKQATDIIQLIFDGFTDALAKDSKIEIRGFGFFSVRNYKSYSGRNSKTGETIDVKPKRMPFFKVGKELKGMVNSKE